MSHDAAPLHSFHLIPSPGMKQEWFTQRAERTGTHLFWLKPVLLELERGCPTDVESVPSGFIVGEQHLRCVEKPREVDPC